MDVEERGLDDEDERFLSRYPARYSGGGGKRMGAALVLREYGL